MDDGRPLTMRQGPGPYLAPHSPACPARNAAPYPAEQPRPPARPRLAAWMSGDEWAALEAVALPPRLVRTGADLVPEGSETDHVHLIQDGWACRYKTTRDGGRQIVGLALPGDVANVDSLLFDRLDVGIRPLTPMTVVSLPRDRLVALAAAHPGIARALTWTALVENAILSDWALSLGRRTAERRLARLLCEVAARLGAADRGVFGFDWPLTQEQIADALGLTAVHVNRVMQRLRGDGLIVTAGRHLTIPDIARLHAAGDFDPAYLHHGQARAAPTHLAAPTHDAVLHGWGAGIMRGDLTGPSPGYRQSPDYSLLLRETNHRCANDLQLVVSLLSLQSRRATSQEARDALADAMARVAILARSRAELNRERQPSLESALRQVCEALHAQAEPRRILISFVDQAQVHGLSQVQTAALTLAVNELATNAIKHAFQEGKPGQITVTLRRNAVDDVVIVVDDDGLPFAEETSPKGTGLGLELVKRLVASAGGFLIAPRTDAKAFEIRVPTGA